MPQAGKLIWFQLDIYVKCKVVNYVFELASRKVFMLKGVGNKLFGFYVGLVNAEFLMKIFFNLLGRVNCLFF